MTNPKNRNGMGPTPCLVNGGLVPAPKPRGPGPMSQRAQHEPLPARTRHAPRGFKDGGKY